MPSGIDAYLGEAVRRAIRKPGTATFAPDLEQAELHGSGPDLLEAGRMGEDLRLAVGC